MHRILSKEGIQILNKATRTQGTAIAEIVGEWETNCWIAQDIYSDHIYLQLHRPTRIIEKAIGTRGKVTTHVRELVVMP